MCKNILMKRQGCSAFFPTLKAKGAKNLQHVSHTADNSAEATRSMNSSGIKLKSTKMQNRDTQNGKKTSRNLDLAYHSNPSNKNKYKLKKKHSACQFERMTSDRVLSAHVRHRLA